MDFEYIVDLRAPAATKIPGESCGNIVALVLVALFSDMPLVQRPERRVRLHCLRPGYSCQHIIDSSLSMTMRRDAAHLEGVDAVDSPPDLLLAHQVQLAFVHAEHQYPPLQTQRSPRSW